MERFITMIDEYAYYSLFPFSSVGSSGASVSGSINGQCDEYNSSLNSLTSLRKSEICTYKSILKNNNNLDNCDYFRPSISQSVDSQKNVHDIQTISDLSICSYNNEVDRNIKSTNTEPGFIVALSSFLTQIATSNSSSSSCNVGILTPFHSVCIPPIPIRAYLIRLAQNFGCSNECFVLAIIYVGRIIRYNRNFTITLLNVHRVIVTALILATKFFDDIYYSNAFYAKISGVGTRELNSLEIHFLRLIRFQLFVTEYEYETYKRSTIKSAVPHSAIPSLPVNIFNKQVPDDLRNNSQPIEANFIGEGKHLYVRNSSYNYNYPAIYNSFQYGKKLENCDIQAMLFSEYSLNSHSHSTGNLYMQRLNSTSNYNTELPTNYDLCSKQPFEMTNFELAPYSQHTQNYYDIHPEKWTPQQYSFEYSSPLNHQIHEKFGNVNKPHGQVKNNTFSREIDAPTPLSSPKNRNDNPSVNLKRQATSFISGCARRQTDNSKTLNTNLNFSNYSNTEFQFNNLYQRQIEHSEAQVSNIHPEYKNVMNLNNNLFSNEMGYYNSVNTLEVNVSSTANVITSSAATLVNPTVNHYGQHIFMNPYNFRCSTGIDRRLLV